MHLDLHKFNKKATKLRQEPDNPFFIFLVFTRFYSSFTFHDSIFLNIFIWLAFDIFNFILLPFYFIIVISLFESYWTRRRLSATVLIWFWIYNVSIRIYFGFIIPIKVLSFLFVPLLSSCKVLAFCWSVGWVPRQRTKIINFILNFNFMTLLLFKSIFYQYFIASFYYNFSFGCWLLKFVSKIIVFLSKFL